MDKFMHRFCQAETCGNASWYEFAEEIGEDKLDELAQRYLFSSERHVDNVDFEEYVRNYIHGLTKTPVRRD